jgi:hypothetical protein
MVVNARARRVTIYLSAAFVADGKASTSLIHQCFCTTGRRDPCSTHASISRVAVTGRKRKVIASPNGRRRDNLCEALHNAERRSMTVSGNIQPLCHLYIPRFIYLTKVETALSVTSRSDVPTASLEVGVWCLRSIG